MSGVPSVLNRAADRLRIYLGMTPLDPDPDPDGLEEPDASEPLLPEREGPTDNVVTLPGDSAPGPIEEPADLGGLVAALENQVGGEVTRVESAKMYRLINRIVELRLDADSVVQRLQGDSDRAVRLADADDEWLAGSGSTRSLGSAARGRCPRPGVIVAHRSDPLVPATGDFPRSTNGQGGPARNRRRRHRGGPSDRRRLA